MPQKRGKKKEESESESEDSFVEDSESEDESSASEQESCSEDSASESESSSESGSDSDDDRRKKRGKGKKSSDREMILEREASLMRQASRNMESSMGLATNVSFSDGASNFVPATPALGNVSVSQEKFPLNGGNTFETSAASTEDMRNSVSASSFRQATHGDLKDIFGGKTNAKMQEELDKIKLVTDIVKHVKQGGLKFRSFQISFKGSPMDFDGNNGNIFSLSVEAQKNLYTSPMINGGKEREQLRHMFSKARKVVITSVKVQSPYNGFGQPVGLICESHPFLNNHGVMLTSGENALLSVNPKGKSNKESSSHSGIVYDLSETLMHNIHKVARKNTPVVKRMAEQLKIKHKSSRSYLLIPQGLANGGNTRSHKEELDRIIASEGEDYELENIYVHILKNHDKYGLEMFNDGDPGAYKIRKTSKGRQSILLPNKIVHKAMAALMVDNIVGDAIIKPVNVNEPIRWKLVSAVGDWKNGCEHAINTDVKGDSKDIRNVLEAKVSQTDKDNMITYRRSNDASFIVCVEAVPYFGDDDDSQEPEVDPSSAHGNDGATWLSGFKESVKAEASANKIGINVDDIKFQPKAKSTSRVF